MKLKAIVMATAILASATTASAQTYTLGEQDYTDGVSVSFTEYNTASAGEEAPFDRFYGADPGSNNNFDKTFTVSFAPLNATGANLTFGIYDHDSSVPGSQVAFFGVNGVDLTSDLNNLFESMQGLQTQVRIYSLDLTGSALTAVSSGNAAFTLTLKGPLSSVAPSNGAGLDFASFTVDATAAVVPEPATWGMMLVGFGLVGAGMRRRTSVAVAA
jgi:hypothetical protein